MAIEIQAPTDFSEYLSDNKVVLFLGGSIEMDTAERWQAKVVKAFKADDDVVILNPRRNDWNEDWKPIKSNRQFRQQVEWELEALENASFILMYFDPATKSPISLLETGLFAFDSGRVGPKLHVICPKGYWRKGNVDIVCDRYGIPQHSTISAAIKYIKELCKYIN